MTARTSIERLADDAPVPKPASWPACRPPSFAYDRACAAIEAEARATATAAIKMRARAYALSPRDLDAITPGLSRAGPKVLVIALNAYRTELRRWFGFGGAIPVINLRGAMLYARLARARARRNARRRAA
jgi:hypothetical protein